MGTTNGKLQVFFDGACPLCSREVGVYRKRDVEGRIEWVDIAGAGFEAGAYGVDGGRLNEEMHVRRGDGRVVTGVEGFREVWRGLPRRVFTGVVLGMLRVPGMMWVARVLYRVFARNRYRLTGRCVAEGCEVIHHGGTETRRGY